MLFGRTVTNNLRVDLQFIRKILILGWPRLTWEVLLWPCLLRRSPGPDEDIIQPALHKRRGRWGQVQIVRIEI